MKTLPYKSILTLIMTIALAIPSSAQKAPYAADAPVVVKLWPDGAPSGNGLKKEQEKWNGRRIDHAAEAELFVYPAEKPNGMAIIMCPGGGYTGQAILHEGHDMAKWMNSMGITYAVLKYRVPNLGHFEVPLSDAEMAMRFMRSQAADWGIDPAKVGIAGASAGGHLASTLATHYTSQATRPDFQILFYPVITMEEGKTHKGSRDNLIGKNPGGKLEAKFSNELQVTPETPKAFIMVSADDGAVPVENSLRYATALAQNKVPFSLHVYPTGGHGWGFRDNFTWKPQWTAELEAWLNSISN